MCFLLPPTTGPVWAAAACCHSQPPSSCLVSCLLGCSPLLLPQSWGNQNSRNPSPASRLSISSPDRITGSQTQPRAGPVVADSLAVWSLVSSSESVGGQRDLKLHLLTSLGTLQERTSQRTKKSHPSYRWGEIKWAFSLDILGRNHPKPVSGLVIWESGPVLTTDYTNWHPVSIFDKSDHVTPLCKDPPMLPMSPRRKLKPYKAWAGNEASCPLLHPLENRGLKVKPEIHINQPLPIYQNSSFSLDDEHNQSSTPSLFTSLFLFFSLRIRP